jgi:hypothetical protein
MASGALECTDRGDHGVRFAVAGCSETLVHGVRKMAEHLEEYAEKGFVRDGAYTQLHNDLVAIHNAACANVASRRDGVET